MTEATTKKMFAARRYESIDLLPQRYLARKHARRVFFIWAVVVLTLSSLTMGVLTPVWLRGKRIRAQNTRLIVDSQPLAKLVIKTKQLQLQNQRQTQWNTWVESAKPDDSLLQAIASATVATKSDETGIEIDTMEIQLPLEYPPQSPRQPKWATPRFIMTARVPDTVAAHSWIERITASERLENAGAKLPPATWTGGVVQVTAEPIATCVLP